MSTYTWTIPTGNIINGSTYIKDTDNKIQDTMDDLADFVNSSGAYTGQGLMFDYVDKASNQSITGIKTFSNGIISNVTGNVTGTVSGNSGTATKLATARTITLAGDVTGSVSFDGSANASITTTVGNDSHNHSIAYVTGLQTALDGKLSTSGNAVSATYATSAGNATTAQTATYATNANNATTATNCTNAIGYNQSWQNMTSGRSLGTTYTNSTGKPIAIYISRNNTGNNTYQILINGTAIGYVNCYGTNSGAEVIVPSGSTYSATVGGAGSLITWFELR